MSKNQRRRLKRKPVWEALQAGCCEAGGHTLKVNSGQFVQLMREQLDYLPEEFAAKLNLTLADIKTIEESEGGDVSVQLCTRLLEVYGQEIAEIAKDIPDLKGTLSLNPEGAGLYNKAIAQIQEAAETRSCMEQREGEGEVVPVQELMEYYQLVLTANMNLYGFLDRYQNGDFQTWNQMENPN